MSTTEQALAMASVEDENVILRMARNAIEVGDYGTAMTILAPAWRAKPQDPEVASLYADTLMRTDNAEAALNVLSKARSGQDDNVQLRLQWAKSQLALARPEAALVELEKLAPLAADDHRVANATGIAHDMMGMHEKAVQAYRQAAILAPDNVAVSNNLGLSLALAGRHGEAIPILRKLAEGPNSSSRIRQNLALAYGLKGDLVEARKVALRDLSSDQIADNIRFYRSLRSSGETYRFKADLQPVPAMVENKENAQYQARAIAALALSPDELLQGKSPGGEWYLDLGTYSSDQRSQAIWQVLRKSHIEVLQTMNRLQGAGSGPEPLLVGPVVDEASALDVCEKLGKAVKSCKPIHL